jgi:hypothetical protein
MQETFEARNAVEEKLLSAQEGQLSSEALMDYMMDAQLFMPVKPSMPIESFTSSDKAVPLTLKADENVEVLILFTSPDRSKGFLQDFPVMTVVYFPNSNGCSSEPAVASASPLIRTGPWAWTWSRR